MAIVESMFDLIFAQGHFPRQHVVETFTGTDLDLERWVTADTAGVNAFQMSDSINGGFEIVADNSPVGTADLDFGTVRQYSALSSVYRTVVKSAALTDNQTVTGFTDDLFVNDYYTVEAFESNSNYQNFHRGTTGTRTDTGVATDTVYHLWEGEAFSASVTLRDDGTLTSTATTDLPVADLEPHFRQRSFLGNQTGNWTWFEAFNK